MMRTDMSHQKFSIVPPPQDRPMPTLWTERDRGIAECGLDSETAVTLNCVVRGVFEAATNWDGLVADLADTGFGLRFEGEAEVRALAPGDFVHIPAHKRHRVEWTAADEPTVWLALHYES